MKKKVAEKRTCVLVLGMHRSGTSAITRVLNIAGAKLPTNMMGPGAGNETGHWESNILAHCSDDILNELDSAWHDWRALEINRLSAKRRDEIIEEIRGIIEAEYNQAPFFVVKDPRICRFAPLFIEALTDADFDVRVVLIFRNPLEVCESLELRNNLSKADAALLWLRHVLDAESASRKLKRSIFTYDLLLNDWKTVFKKLSGELALNNTHDVNEIAPQIDEFLSPKHRHHMRTTEDVSDEPLLRDWIGAAYEQLLVLAQNSKSQMALARLDAIAGEFNRSNLFLYKLNSSMRATESDEISELRNSLNDRYQQLSESRATREEALRESQELTNVLTMREEEISQINIAAAQSEAMIAELKRAIAQQRRETKKTNSALIKQKMEAEKLKELLSQAGSNEAVLLERIAQAEGDAGHFETTSTQRGIEIAELKGELARVTTTLTKYISQNQSLLAQLAEYRQAVQLLKFSNSWKITRPLRFISRKQKALRSLFSVILTGIKYGGGIFGTLEKAIKLYRKNGMAGIMSGIEVAIQREVQKQNIVPISNSIEFINQIVPGRKHALNSKWHRNFSDCSKGVFPAELPNITISAITFNSEKWLDNFVNSLNSEIFSKEKINLFFVDHGSSDATLSLLRKYKAENGKLFHSIKIFERPNLGYGCGNDYAIKMSRDDFVLVTNVDVEFHGDTLEKIVAAAIGDDKDVACWEVRQYPFEHPKYYDPVTLETSWCSHACILIRRSAYLKVGGYEQQIFMYGEDVELSYRFRCSNWKLRYVPFATITHHVDLNDASLRPSQFSGSIYANVMLRHRYGTDAEAAEGERMLYNLEIIETEPARVNAIRNAIAEVNKNRKYFQKLKQIPASQSFPFNGFDYHIRRDGHAVALIPLTCNAELPLVSVITRTHGEKVGLLKEAITSIINQSYSNIEHIIVEDRTDYARDIVEELSSLYSTKIRYIKSDGTGRSRAGNCGLKNANGEFIMLLDNDDLLFADHIEILVSRLIGNGNVVAAYAYAWEVQTASGDEESEYKELLHVTPIAHKLPYDKARLQQSNFIPIQAILIRRELYEKYGGFHEDLDYLEDWNLWARYSNGGNFELVPKTTSEYKTSSDVDLRKKRQQLLDQAYKPVLQRISSDAQKIR